MGRRTLQSNQLFAERYEIIKVLGDGGMGTVYLAVDKIIREEVALKVMHADYSEDSKHVERFIREVQVSRKIANPHVVRTYDAGLHEGQLFFTMECVLGDSLKTELKGGPFDPLDVATIMMQVCDGLAAIHDTQVVHRDLKPANMIRAQDGTIKIADFGIARNEMSQLTGHEEVIGSTAYMAPEIWSGKEIGPPADIYALGISAFELIANDLPFRANTPAELMWKHLEQSPPALKEKVESVPGWLNDLILILLEKNPEARPCRAVEIRDFLMGHLDSDCVTDEVFVVHPSPTVLSTKEREQAALSNQEYQPTSGPGYHTTERVPGSLYTQEMDPYSAAGVDAPLMNGTEYELEPFVDGTGELAANRAEELVDRALASTSREDNLRGAQKKRGLSYVFFDWCVAAVVIFLLLYPVSDFFVVRWRLALAARHGWQLSIYALGIFCYYAVLMSIPSYLWCSLARFPSPKGKWLRMGAVVFAILCSFLVLSIIALDPKLQGASKVLQVSAYSSAVEPAIVKTLHLALLQPFASVYEVVSRNGVVLVTRNPGKVLAPLDWYYAMMFVYLFTFVSLSCRSKMGVEFRLKLAMVVMLVMSAVIAVERLLAPSFMTPNELGIVERVSAKVGIFFPVSDWYSILCGGINWGLLLLGLFLGPPLIRLFKQDSHSPE